MYEIYCIKVLLMLFIYTLIIVLFMENIDSTQSIANCTESNREIFVRLANSRVNKVLSCLEVLKKLSSRKSSYTQKDVLAMKKHLYLAVDEALESFKPSANLSKTTFSLDI